MLLFVSPNLWANQHDANDLYPSIYFEADNLLYEDDGKNIKASGNAKLFYKSYIVEAAEITYLQEIDQVIATGNVTMSDKGKVKITANKISAVSSSFSLSTLPVFSSFQCFFSSLVLAHP